MIDWNKYPRADGEWAEVGAFILEASANGSWVVRHKVAAVPCRASADIGAPLEGGIDGAKEACERVLGEVLAAHDDTAAVAQQKAVTVALCRRYQTMRENQRSDHGLDDLEGTTADLDGRVADYLKKNGQQ